MTTIKQIKWQLEAEFCLIQIILSIIVWKLFGGWIVGGLCALSIIGNLMRLIKATKILGVNYYKDNK